ncbi:MAG: type II secretion system F family protein, partial [Holosporaceae bacterium]
SEAPYESDAIALFLLKAGEQSGQLEKTLSDVLVHLEKVVSFQKDVKAAVRYPLFLCGVLGVTFVILCQLLVPQLIQLSSEEIDQASFATRSLLCVVGFFQGQDGALLWVLLSAVGLLTLVRLTKAGRFFCQYLFLKVPLWGVLTMASQWSYFFYLLSLGVKTGFPLHKALCMAQTVLSSAPLQNVIREAGKEVVKGRSLAAALKGAPGILEETKILLDLAQKAKDASCVYTKISLFYEERRALLAGYLLSYLGPCFLIVIGVLFLWLVQGLFLPFYEHALSLDGVM